MSHDFDFIIVGSGFGGSVSALRLAEKGYSVCVIEQGKRFAATDFAKSNWDVRKYLWLPVLKCFGIQRISFFKDIAILSGSGVGGGSLVYANTLMQPGDAFFNSPVWSHLGSWKSELEPHYAMARKMLGAVRNKILTHVDTTLQECATELGRGETFAPTDVAIYFGEPGKTVPDPYFNGEGPERKGCVLCGGCMVGCRHNAKNTLDKNYLYLAEKKGTKVFAERRVKNVRPIHEVASESADKPGYYVDTECSTAWFKKSKKTLTAQNIIFSGGVLGTVDLLLRCRDEYKSLPKLSPTLGQNILTNSEVFTGSTELKHNPEHDYSKGIAISSIFKPDNNTSIEPVRYPKGSDFMKLLAGPLVDDPRTWVRPFKFLWHIICHPVQLFKLVFHRNWAESTVIFLVMQNLDNRIRFHLGRGPLRLFRKSMMSTPMPGAVPIPSEIPIANKTARLFAEKVNGVTQCPITQVTFNIPITAHILGGCAIGENAEKGVVDKSHRVFNYEGLFVCDGSVMPTNLGVNPSLTITAMTERAMTFIPIKSEK